MNQLKAIQEIYRTANVSPIFRSNAAFALGMADDEVPYISLGDVFENRYIIRLLPEGDMNNYPITRNGRILVEYTSIEHLVRDGWELD